MSYPRLPIEEFGRELLITRDLDPIYVALQEVDLPSANLSRWLVSYWTFYSAGVSCWMSERPDDEFWQAMHVAAENEAPAPHGGRWARGAERRHCRGQAAVKCVADLSGRYRTAHDMVDFLKEGDSSLGLPFRVVRDRVKRHHLFGDWIAYKVGDMLERCWGANVVFDFGDAMYDEPRKAAGMVWNEWNPGSDPCDGLTDVECVSSVVDGLLHEFRQFRAPPRYDRVVGLQEVETILCKWKSHTGGHYAAGKDIREISHGLEPWLTRCETARRFADAMKFPVMPERGRICVE